MEFALVGVFAMNPLSGNPLAVVADADGFADEVMRLTPTGAEVFGAGHDALGAWLFGKRERPSGF